MEDEVLFFERQFMPTWALIVVAIAGLILPGAIILANEAPPLMVFLIIVLLVIFVMFASMQTRVTNKYLHVSFGLIPLIQYRYMLGEIIHFEPRVYQPVNEYGGWGIKGSKQNRALSMQGTKGIQLEMTAKEGGTWKLLIGTQSPDRLQAALKQVTS